MKKLIFLLSNLLFILIVVSCDHKKEDSVPPKAVENVTVKAGYGELMFSWTRPDDPDLYYVDITYIDSQGKKRSHKVSQYVDKDTITGFADTGEYTFRLTAYDENDNASSVATVKASPLSPPFVQVAGTIAMSPDFGGARITWTNQTKKTVTIMITYKNNDGAVVSSLFPSAEEHWEEIISGLNSTARSFMVVVTDASEGTSEKKNFDITPLMEKAIPKTGWTVTGVSSEEPAENPNGYARNIFDGNVNSFWHTAWSGAQPAYPHWVSIDMHQEVTISRFECFRRQGDGRGETKVQFLTSLDGNTWEDQGKFDFNPSTNDGQSFRMKANPRARYFKFVAVEGPNYYAFLGEINVFGSGQ